MAKKSKIKRPSSMGVTSSTSARVEFNPDYSTTKRDLKRIGALAGFFFAALIALSYFLR